MLLGTDVCVRMVFMWEETGVPGGNPPVWLGDHMTISHADAGYQTRVAAVRGECVITAPARQPEWFYDCMILNLLQIRDPFLKIKKYLQIIQKWNFASM